MAKKRKKSVRTTIDPTIKKLDEIAALLKDLLILELGNQDVPQVEIGKIVKIATHRVNRLLKHSKKSK